MRQGEFTRGSHQRHLLSLTGSNNLMEEINARGGSSHAVEINRGLNFALTFHAENDSRSVVDQELGFLCLKAISILAAMVSDAQS